MALNRRKFLIGAGGLAAAATGIGLGGCANSTSSSGGPQNEKGVANLSLAWWGNPTRNKNTEALIAAYMKTNPGVTITGQPGEYASYWDKLATQTAGGDAPDIIQTDTAHIAEYGGRGAMLDLAKYGADTSKFVEGTTDSGKINGTLYGVNAGINTVVLFANPEVFNKANVSLPDDTTWTWDDLQQIASEVASKASVPFGVAGMFGSDQFLAAWLRQHGKELFTDQGLGFDAADVQSWFELMVKYQKAKAIGTPEMTTEEAAKSLDQSALVVGRAAMQFNNSNQLEAINAASGTSMRILRFPSLAGKATERKAWYNASMLWSASSKTKNPEAAVAWINWFINSREAESIDKAERGFPANGDIQAYISPKLSTAQQTVAKFIADIKPELGSSPIPMPPGGATIGEVLSRHESDVLFGRSNTADAAKKFADEVTSNLQG